MLLYGMSSDLYINCLRGDLAGYMPLSYRIAKSAIFSKTVSIIKAEDLKENISEVFFLKIYAYKPQYIIKSSR